MKHRVLAALTAALTLLAATPVIPTVSAADSYDMAVTVELGGTKKPISPYIFGINDAGQLDNVTVGAVRQGGNRYSGYNWENNFSNAGSDWKNNSDTYLTQGFSKELAATPGAPALHLADDCEKHGIGYKMTTIPMAGYVSADGNGEVTAAETAPSTRWKQVKAAKGAEFSMTPDTTDDYVYMDEYVNYLVKTLGSAKSGGINGYNLDNEPGLWSSTHSLMHPDKTTYAEMVDKSTEFASAIKAVDPDAEVFGLALFGVYAYYNLADAPDKDGSYDWFLSYYLDKMKAAEAAAGKRLIDAIDVHYYSEAKGDNRVTEGNATTENDRAARVQAPRTLYEDGYREVSWITDALSSYMPFLPTIQNSITKYYPGTKLAMTEYNFGGGDDVTGAIAQVDALGAFAANDVYLATLWPLSSSIDYQLSAINLYTNYDGKGGAFGDTLVPAKTADWEKSIAYAAIDGDDTSELTVVLANKDSALSENAQISIPGGNYKSAVVYGVTQDSSDIKVLDVQNDLSGDSVVVTLPPYSAATVVLSGEEAVVTPVEEPEITTKEVTLNFSDLEKGKDGLLIPIEDPEHLTKAVIDVTSTCSDNVTWFGGGGALCFNELQGEDGSTFWGAKSFNYSGTGKVTVKFDGTFSVPGDDPDVMDTAEGTITEKNATFQEWWKGSETSTNGDNVTTTFNTITLYYEYENEVAPSEETPSEETPSEETPSEETPSEETPSEETPSEETPSEETPSEETPSEETPSEETGKLLYGDVNEDGEIDILDVIKINKYLLGCDTLSPQGLKNANVDANEAVDPTDSLNILKAVVALLDPSKFPNISA